MRSRASGLVGTVLVHLALILLALLWRQPAPLIGAAAPALLTFDVRPDPPPPPDPQLPPEPALRDQTKVQRPSASGAPRPSRAPPAPVSDIRLPEIADVTIAPDAPARPLAGFAELFAFGLDGGRAGPGNGTGGSGSGSGSGRGKGGNLGAMRRAEWIRRPTDDELTRFWPEKAKADRISGHVVLACIVPRPGRPRSCLVESKTPVGIGFGEAALRLWPTFRIKPVMRDRATIDLPIRIPVVFDVIVLATPDLSKLPKPKS